MNGLHVVDGVYFRNLRTKLVILTRQCSELILELCRLVALVAQVPARLLESTGELQDFLILGAVAAALGFETTIVWFERVDWLNALEILRCEVEGNLWREVVMLSTAGERFRWICWRASLGRVWEWKIFRGFCQILGFFCGREWEMNSCLPLHDQARWHSMYGCFCRCCCCQLWWLISTLSSAIQWHNCLLCCYLWLMTHYSHEGERSSSVRRRDFVRCFRFASSTRRISVQVHRWFVSSCRTPQMKGIKEFMSRSNSTLYIAWLALLTFLLISCHLKFELVIRVSLFPSLLCSRPVSRRFASASRSLPSAQCSALLDTVGNEEKEKREKWNQKTVWKLNSQLTWALLILFLAWIIAVSLWNARSWDDHKKSPTRHIDNARVWNRDGIRLGRRLAEFQNCQKWLQHKNISKPRNRSERNL